jgi:hypothetical protein
MAPSLLALLALLVCIASTGALVQTHPEKAVSYQAALSLVGDGRIHVTLSCAAGNASSCCLPGTVSQLVVALGKRAQTIIWPCGADGDALLSIPVSQPRATHSARVSLLFANISSDVFSNIVPPDEAVFVDARLAEANLSVNASKNHARVPSNKTSWTWVHLLGDSVSRSLFVRACEGVLHWPLVEPRNERAEKDALALTCCDPASGKCLSWERWWLIPAGSGGPANLTKALPDTLACRWTDRAAVMRYVCSPHALIPTSASSPDAVLITLPGSHAPELNRSAAVQQLFHALLSSIDAPVIWAATTAVREPAFPERYLGDLFARNNLRLATLNDLAAAACARIMRCRQLDLFSFTLAVLDMPGAYTAGDPVHPTRQIVTRLARAALRSFGGLDEGYLQTVSSGDMLLVSS